MAKKKISPINEDFDFKLFVTIARKNALWFALFMLVAIFVALLILRYTAPTYEVQAIIKIANENKAQNVLGINTQSSQLYDESNEIAGDIELIRSKIIVERAISKLPLQVSYFSKGALLEYELFRQSPFEVEFVMRDSSFFGTPVLVDFPSESTAMISYVRPEDKKAENKKIPVGSWVRLPECDLRISIQDYVEIKRTQKEINKDAYYFVINQPGTVAEDILKNLSVAVLNPEAKTVQIKLKEKNNRKAAEIVNSITAEFNKYDVEKNSEVANKVLDFIDNTISSINIELSNSENSLEQFKKRNRILSPEITINMANSRMTQLQETQFSLEHQLALFESLLKDIQGNNDIGKFLLSLSGSSDNQLITGQIAQLNDLLNQREEIRVQATEKSEIFKNIETRIKHQRDLLTQTILNEEAQLRIQEKQIKNQLMEFDSKLGKIPDQQAEFGRLQRLFNINEKFYSLLLEKKAEFSITRAGYVPQHVILQEAKSNMQPVSPNRALIISACLMIGFIISMLLILTRYLLYNEINALEEIGQYTDAALLGIIPKYKREIPVSQLLVDKNPKSVISEAFRSVRTNLQFISNDAGAKLIAVTSTISGEGKTFNAINLAGVIAFSGKKVVILDLDMRKPKIHLGFNVENNHGISTLLIGKDLLENCIIHSSLPNLDFITAGPIPPNPAELIINPRMDQLLDQLKEKYDIIIIDLPPVGIVSDGIPIMQRVDYPLYILRANYSRKMFIAQVNKLITENKINNLSIILNGVEMSRMRYGYGYSYSYGYGYGYGYSYGYGYYEEDDKPKKFLDRLVHSFRRKP